MENLLKHYRYEPSEDPIRSNRNATMEEIWQPPFKMGPHVWHCSGHEDQGCYLIETTEGLVFIDTPSKRFHELTFRAIEESGHDVKDIRYYFITHWHGDHDGCAGYLKEASGCKIIMTAEDWGCKCNMPVIMGRKIFEKPDYTPDILMWDETQDFVIGNITFHVSKGPGHTPGCMVIYFDDVDPEDGQVYHLAIHGGLGCETMNTKERLISEHIDPACRDRFIDQCLEMARWDVDICLPSHLNHSGLRRSLCEDRNNWKWYVDKRTWPVMLLERRGYVMERRGEEEGPRGITVPR